MAAKKKHRDDAPAQSPGPTDCASVPTSAEFCAQLRQHLAAELAKPNGADASVTNFQALSAKLVEMAVGGSKDAIQIVLDRMAGRTPQAAAVPDENSPERIEYVIEIPRPDHEHTSQAASETDLQSVRQTS